MNHLRLVSLSGRFTRFPPGPHVALILALFALPATLPAQPTTLYVDVSNPNCPGAGTAANPYCTIQSGINAARNGDLVLVRPGTYKEKINFGGKAITVRSTKGAVETIIDGSSTPWQSVVSFRGAEGKTTVLEGFSVINGMGSQYTYRGSLTDWFGGGILCERSSPTIRSVIVCGNHARYGGGICCVDGASPTVEDCLFDNNRAFTNGGGAVAMQNCKPRFERCIFRSNICAHTGGGLNFRDNSNPTLVNCTFDGNFAGDYGGGIRAGATSSGTMTNCTFVKNVSRWGGGLAVGSDTQGILGTINVTNSILWGNLASKNGAQISLNGLWPAVINLSYCDVQGGPSQVFKNIVNNPSAAAVNWGAGMLTVNPKFVDPSISDFHIRYDSPCRNKGLNTAPSIATTDFEGDPRVANTTVDMGVDEFFEHLYYTGNLTAGGTVKVNAIGKPNSNVLLGLSVGPRNPPISLPGLGGLLRLGDPIVVLPMSKTAATGRAQLSITVPCGLAKLSVWTQALIGTTLSNLSVITLK
ncbi:MAG: right-handed parallel beta-helix repeat-containing protein [Planctomycetota bacterium]|jgi:predicted outer membrane repeat protein